ncbi:MAG TPA: 1-(5-phosphoribosyl)-5-[(5-phosphoribosylamino)methylideneamino] imidazole-4-carboxamide isomerase [Candidatus Limnocylindrales bacterium]|nr:1-(5-phosphoribosyl)-5-[(5-phosphoribosylamino)methylideneamino] imidazole-4-carboxamide isomerase [Candidatus Limnocylindrales bacterium]
MARFDLIAAIDLRGGRVVRLREGDFGRETTYGDDPISVAVDFVNRGVRWLHVVDLDGARAGEPVHAAVIGRLLDAVGDRAAVEVAGGLRTAAAADQVLAGGARRVVVGSAALADPAFAADLVARHGPDRVVVALDVRDGLAVGQAWRAGAPGAPVHDVIDALMSAGVGWYEVTAIDRDGSLGGPDLSLLQTVVARAAGCRVIAAGGIATVEDMLAAWTVGCVGAIVGRGIYEGTLDLEQALRATRPGE